MKVDRIGPRGSERVIDAAMDVSACNIAFLVLASPAGRCTANEWLEDKSNIFCGARP